MVIGFCFSDVAAHASAPAVKAAGIAATRNTTECYPDDAAAATKTVADAMEGLVLDEKDKDKKKSAKGVIECDETTPGIKSHWETKTTINAKGERVYQSARYDKSVGEIIQKYGERFPVCRPQHWKIHPGEMDQYWQAVYKFQMFCECSEQMLAVMIKETAPDGGKLWKLLKKS